MKITLNWLRKYVDFDGTPEALAERLTLLGLEVEGLQKLGGEFPGIVVAQVVTRDRHPNADKLSVCRVNDGAGERQIVCGAQNFQPGDKVPLILPGSALPPKPGEREPFVIKVGKIRGVESHGMLCSADELQIDPVAHGLKKEDGLLILQPDARVGQSFAEYLGRGGSDVVYDLEVTPNRPDLNSVIGIAREIAAVTGRPLRLPEIRLTEGTDSVQDLVSVRLEASELCPRYTARVLRDVTLGPSPDWLRDALAAVGLRSINNVVDVTNFTMLETGQPLHAFDYRLVARGDDGRPTVVVRRAAAGESFVTLDGKSHVLGTDNLLIADPSRGIALAGVMGGQNSEIGPQTVDVLLESACFSPTNIRRTSKGLGIRTDASYRFERGADIGMTDWASRRAAALILETAGGTLAKGVVDAYPEPVAPRRISLRHARANALLGLSLPPEEIEFFLGQLGLEVVGRRPRPVDAEGPPDPVTFQIPTFRLDLKREADLIEEVARLYGVDRIPSTEPRYAKGTHPFDARYDELMLVRRFLAGLGLDEACGQTLVSGGAVAATNPEETIRLANPLSSDMDVLRPSLLPGLLDILAHNARHKNPDLALFEVGRVFGRKADVPTEGWRLAIALTGARQPGFWTGESRDARFELVDLKGVLEEFFEHLGFRAVTFARRTESTPFWIESATLAPAGRPPMGEMGWLHPRWARRFDLRDAVLMAELDLDVLLAKRVAVRSFKALPGFPAVRRDVALLVPDAVTHDAVTQAVRKARAAHLEAVELFDVFRGGQVPEGSKSVAYAFTYRAADRTLTDAEVDVAHEALVKDIVQRLGASRRA